MANTLRKEDLLEAQQAADWLYRMRQDPDLQTRAEFVRWLRASPSHVHAMLIADLVDHELCYIDPQRKIDLGVLMAAAQSNVVRVEIEDDAAE